MKRRMMIGVAIVALGVIAAVGKAAETPNQTPPAPAVPDPPNAPPNLGPGVPPNDPAVQARMPGCAVWTDRCVTCQFADGKVDCSNTGIACLPQAVVCLRAEAAEPKKPGN